MAVCYWCEQEGADLAFCEWRVPLRGWIRCGALDLDRTVREALTPVVVALDGDAVDGGRRCADSDARGHHRAPPARGKAATDAARAGDLDGDDSELAGTFQRRRD